MSVSWSRTRTVGRTEIRRRWRVIKANTAQLISIGLMCLFFLPGVLAILAGAYFGGSALRAGDLATPAATVREIAVTLWLFAAVFGGFRGYSSLLEPDCRDGLLTTISHRQLVAGLLLAEAAAFGLPIGLVAAAAGVVFALGSGSALAAPAILVAIGLLVSTGFLTGLAVVLVFKNGGVRSRLLSRLRTVVFVALFLIYMSVIVTNSFGALLDPFYLLLTPTPIGWVGELALLSTAASGPPLLAGSGLVVSIVGLGLSGPVVSRLTAWLWYADGLEPRETDTAPTTAGGSRLSRLLPQPIAGVVAVDWTRARRAPISLSYAVYPLFLLITPVIETIEAGTVGGGFPLLVAVCGVWITGALFTLNVVGNEGSVLPSTLLAPDPGRAIIGGHIAAGTLVGLPATAAAVALLGVLSPQPLWAVATLTLGSLLLVVAAAAIATGIGAALPRYEAVSVSRSRKAIVPSTLAFLLYSIVIGLVSLPLVVGHSHIIASAVTSTLGLPRTGLALAGLVVSTVLAASCGLVSVLYARRRVDRFQFD
ncbi:MAG: hypothetical protein U9O06_02950 [Euryarchaeota archaeon]|nr:hypothetical protein [Euryarchaeota archaeon]